MVQAKQPALVVRFGLPSLFLGSAIASAEMSPAPSKPTSRILCAGNPPTPLITFINTWVPYMGKPWPVTAPSANTFLPASTASMNFFASSRLPTPPVPRIATAFKFFEAITVPTPERPAARCLSFMTAAYRQPASAVRPIQAIRICGSWWVACRISSVSQADLPQMASAERSSTLSSCISKYTGFLDFPSKMIISQPANFISAPRKPPELEAAIAPVSGLLHTTE